MVVICVGNSQFAPIRKPSEFTRSHRTSQRAVQTCELVPRSSPAQRCADAALAWWAVSVIRNSHQFAIICNSRIRTPIRKPDLCEFANIDFLTVSPNSDGEIRNAD